MSDELPAGPDLDARVAEKVMGWRYTIGETSHKGRVIAWPLPDYSGIEFSPSTDIAAAWLVVEKIRADGLLFELETVADADGPHDAWRAVIYSGPCYGSAYAPTAPEAICRAALKTLEAK